MARARSGASVKASSEMGTVSRRRPPRSAMDFNAARSSSTTPAPFFTRSRAEAGQGFRTSKIRNRTKPAPTAGQEKGAKAIVTRYPATSSMTMGDASATRQYLPARSAA